MKLLKYLTLVILLIQIQIVFSQAEINKYKFGHVTFIPHKLKVNDTFGEISLNDDKTICFKTISFDHVQCAMFLDRKVDLTKITMLKPNEIHYIQWKLVLVFKAGKVTLKKTLYGRWKLKEQYFDRIKNRRCSKLLGFLKFDEEGKLKDWQYSYRPNQSRYKTK